MNSDVLDYNLPEALIAQFPNPKRDEARLLVVERRSGRISDSVFKELPDILQTPYAFFRNNAAVLKARIFAEKQSGGAVECLLLTPRTQSEWLCMIKPAKRLKIGAQFGVNGVFNARVLEKFEDGTARIEFETVGNVSVIELAEKIGVAPLPPYIRRKQNSPDYDRAFDNAMYETVYADPSKRLAAAAPTAGMHFTKELEAALVAKGHKFYDLTLNVGIGTFQPLKSYTVEEHKMHSEIYEIPPAALKALEAPNRLAVGTTSVRALEDFWRKRDAGQTGDLKNQSYTGAAELFIYPPQRVECANALITNFHLPRSTLLCLVASFICPDDTLAIEKLKEIYARAIAKGYKFFSYGDAMLVI